MTARERPDDHRRWLRRAAIAGKHRHSLTPGETNSYEARVQLEEAVDAWSAMKAEDVARAADHLNDVFCAIIHFKGGNMYRRASKFAVADY